MYKSSKNKLLSYFYYSYVKDSFSLVHEVENKERIYYKDEKVFIEVLDSEVGARLYNTIKEIDRVYVILKTATISLEMDNFAYDKDNVIKWISLRINFSIEYFLNLSKPQKLNAIVRFIEYMHMNGFVLDSSIFQTYKCNSVTEFLSFFTKGDDINLSEGCLIKYIHFMLSNGGDLEGFYKYITKYKKFCKLSDFPYSLPLIRMCYNYFKDGTIPEDIITIVDNEEYKTSKDYLIFLGDDFKAKFSLKEETDKYIIYENGIKIYKYMSDGFKEFLKISELGDDVVEEIDRLIINIDGSVIGYIIKNAEQQKVYSIFDNVPNTQRGIIDYICTVSKSLNNFRNKVVDRGDCEEDSQEFDVIKSLVYLQDYNDSHCWKIVNSDDLYQFLISDKQEIDKQITKIFFRMLFDCINQKYGKVSSKNELLEKQEIRFLSPAVAREFIKFAFDSNKINYDLATSELIKFIKKHYSSDDYSYDARFVYNPESNPFLFINEVEDKYGIKIVKGMKEVLSDGRRVITFDRCSKVSNLSKKDVSIHQDLRSKLDIDFQEYLKNIEIDELIYSRDLNKENMYKLVGYITQPIKGKQLTDELLLNLSNKDIIKVAGRLFCHFYDYTVPFNNIYMDEDFVFYIDIWDEGFQIKECDSDIVGESVKRIFDRLIDKGYNPSAFVDIDFSYRDYQKFQRYLLRLADSYDAFCDEHSIFYDSYEGQCPVCKKSKYLVPSNYESKFKKVFEDSVAIHYNNKNGYNLKVYKKSFKDLKVIQENIDKIIGKRLSSMQINMYQDCFIPYKKAVDGNNQFIGYIYEAENFEVGNTSNDVCINIEDGVNLKNLPRLKSLIRLILQVELMASQGFGFIDNPFGNVFLNAAHKKQVQILNVDFLCEGNLDNLKKWTYDYVIKVLSDDSNIEMDPHIIPYDLDTLLSRLKALDGDMKKYCSIHKIYYKESNLFCPKCSCEMDIKNLEIKKERKSNITDDTPINEGGEALIFNYDKKTVAKVFKTDKIDQVLKNVMLSRILNKKSILESINNQELKFKYIYPQKLLVDKKSNEIFGYLMDEIKNAYPISNLRDKDFVKKINFDRKDILEVIITIGEGIETLHKEANIFIGDLNGRNILFDSEKNVYFIDFDGMGIDDISPEFCTDGYIDPVSKKNKNITMRDDWYSYAIQTFCYLTYTHPYDGIYEYSGKMFTITDKMENRISLLGNHGIKVPSIAESWDWMNIDLRNAFLEIFEGDNRDSIVPYLKKQYKTLFSSEVCTSINKIHRINSKFIAKELEVFKGKKMHIINHFSAQGIDVDGDTFVAILLKNKDKIIQKDIYINTSNQIKDVILSKNKKIAFIIFDKEVIAINLDLESKIYQEEISDSVNVVVNDNSLYFTGIYKKEFVIFKRTFDEKSKNVEREVIRIGNQGIDCFNVQYNSKFVLLRRTSDSIGEVYCNSEKFYTIDLCYRDSIYNIIYDEPTKSWLVINSEGSGIVIEKDGNYKTVDFSDYINDENIKTIVFKKGKLYVPNNDYLNILNVNDETKTKTMECHEFMTPDSQLFNFNANGFSVLTNNVLYEVCRG